MNKLVRIAGFTLLLTGLSTAKLVAQQGSEDTRDNSLVEGRTSISFRLPDSGISTIGIWHVISRNTNLGLLVDLRYRQGEIDEGESSREENRRTIALQPIAQWYLDTDQRVAPFFFASVFLNTFRNEDVASATRDGISAETTSYGVNGGAGAEWFPVPAASVGGRVGVQLGTSHSRAVAAAETDERNIFLNTFTTNLILRIYF